MRSSTGRKSEGLYLRRGQERDAAHANDAGEETTSLAQDDGENQVSSS
jgi:hypothetical protein